MESKVAVLLSTYNGEMFLEQLLDSIIHQSYNNYVIYIRDDGSTDRTKEIINRYKLNNEKKILIMEDELGNIGFTNSFIKLVEFADADYYFFCDQDDIWHVNKISVLTKKIKEAERLYQNIPILTASDLEVIDKSNRLLYHSFLKLSKFNMNYINYVKFRNFFPGCCMCFNQLSKKLLIEYMNINNFSAPFYHDSLLFLLTSLFGKILLDEQKLIKYRINDYNTIGLGKRKPTPVIILLKDFAKYIFRNKEYRKIKLELYFKQVDFLSNKMDKKLLKKFELFTADELDTLSYFKRKKWYFKHFYNNYEYFLHRLFTLLLI